MKNKVWIQFNNILQEQDLLTRILMKNFDSYKAVC